MLGSMVKATCGKCGAVHELSDDQRGGVIECSRCGASISVRGGNDADASGFAARGSQPPQRAAPASRQTLPHGSSRGVMSNGVAANPMPSAPAMGWESGLVEAPSRGGDTGDVIDLAGDPFADLPAPKNSLGAARAPLDLNDLADLPAPKAQLGATKAPLDLDDFADLPAPKSPSGSTRAALDLDDLADLPAPKTQFGATKAPLDLDDLADLPAPKRGSASRQRASATQTASSGRGSEASHARGDALLDPSFQAGDDDMLAPTRPSTNGDWPTAAREPSDLLAPENSQGSDFFADLPAPKHGSDFFADLDDLPAPKGPSDPFANLPTPKGPSDPFANLPTPKGPSDPFANLPTPKGPSDPFANLPTPKGPSDPFANLPTPKGPSDPFANLPTPKNAPVDSPHSAGSIDLPTPKAPFSNQDPRLPAPKRASQPDEGLELPSPPGFFDDLAAAQAGEPSGSFQLEDVGFLANAAGAAEPAVGGFFAGSSPGPETQPAANSARESSALDTSESSSRDRSRSLDLDDFELAPPTMGGPSGSFDVAMDTRSGGPQPFELGATAGDDAFDLGEPLDFGPPTSRSAASADDPGFAELELPPQPAKATTGGVVSFHKAATGQHPAARADRAPVAVARNQQSMGDLDLADEVKPRAAVSSRVAAVAAESANVARPPRTRARQIIAGAALLLVLAGAGGVYLLQRWQARAERAEALQLHLRTAREQLRSGSSAHWQRAAAAAEAALELEPGNSEALGLAAQAYYAATLDGGSASELGPKAEAIMRTINATNAHGADIEKALALQMIAQRNPADAAARLAKLEKDGDTALYRGWALAAAHDDAAAAEAFARAMEAVPARKLPAMYGLATAKLALGEADEARQLFHAILAVDDDHLGALIGAAQAAEPGPLGARENAYMAILQRKDIGNANPPAVARAWTLAADEALRAGRVEVAKTRFEKAMELDPSNIEARVGRAHAALRDNRPVYARELLDQVLKLDSEHLDANLTRAETAIEERDFDDASARAEALLARTPPIANPADLARAHMVRGAVLAERGELETAITAYEQARSLAPPSNVQPTVALANVLVGSGRSKEAAELLAPLELRADGNPALAVTLGVSYLGAGKPALAQKWFENALAQRPSDTEAQLQLGMALYAQGRVDAAIQTLERAWKSELPREDIGLQLALIFEERKRDAEARAQYDSLLASKNPSINARARAGRFFARIGETVRAQELGQSILDEQPSDPAGHFLRGEGLQASGDYEAAEREYRAATELDPNPQYLDGLGRASEALKQWEQALKAYAAASEAAPNYLSPLLGRGRIHLLRNENDRAIEVLSQAAALAPTSSQIQFDLGRAYAAREQHARAVEHFERATRGSGNDLAEVYYHLGMSHVAVDDAARAARALSEATRRAKHSHPWRADALYDLGHLQYSLGQRGAAISAWREYLATGTDASKLEDVRKRMRVLQAR